MLFEAHCFIYCASIFLHFPRSDLPNRVPSTANIACAKGYTPLNPTSRYHTIKAINASKNLSNLAAVPWPLDQHSPFFICSLVLSCVVQMAAGFTHSNQCGLDCLQHHRDRVILMLGALQRLGGRWALARNAVHCLKPAAEVVFSSQNRNELSNCENIRGSFLDIRLDLANSSWFDLLFTESV